LASKFTRPSSLWFFFFWGCLKGKVYNSNPRTEELNENICREIANIPAEQLQRAIRTSSAGTRNVYVYRESIFSASWNLWIVITSFRTFSTNRRIESSSKFVCASQLAMHQSPWTGKG
jgi:hypothetical protein